jgi:hypothetical protein
MKTTQKFRVTSMLNKQRVKDGKVQIFIRIYFDGKRTEISKPQDEIEKLLKNNMRNFSRK